MNYAINLLIINILIYRTSFYFVPLRPLNNNSYQEKRTMEQRKIYEAPATEVVELELQGSLLASSSVNSTGSFAEDGDLNNFEEGWE